MINFIDLIGKNFDTIQINPNSYSIEFDEVMIEIGLDPRWNVKALNGEFEMSLTLNKFIEAIWLFPIDGVFAFNNLTVNTEREFVRKTFGNPDRSGENIEAIKGPPVCFDRYDNEKVSIHFEYLASNLKLKVITLMYPKNHKQ
jgi:hypothetical protein